MRVHEVPGSLPCLFRRPDGAQGLPGRILPARRNSRSEERRSQGSLKEVHPEVCVAGMPAPPCSLPVFRWPSFSVCAALVGSTTVILFPSFPPFRLVGSRLSSFPFFPLLPQPHSTRFPSRHRSLCASPNAFPHQSVYPLSCVVRKHRTSAAPPLKVTHRNRQPRAQFTKRVLRSYSASRTTHLHKLSLKLIPLAHPTTHTCKPLYFSSGVPIDLGCHGWLLCIVILKAEWLFNASS